MATRKPRIRVSYPDDIRYLHRFAEAIERDDSKPLGWRVRIANQVREIAYQLAVTTYGQATQEGDAQEGDAQEGDPQEGDPQEGDPQEGDPQEGDPQEGDPQAQGED